MFAWFHRLFHDKSKLFNMPKLPPSNIINEPSPVSYVFQEQEYQVRYRDSPLDMEALTEIIVDEMFRCSLDVLFLKINAFCEDRGLDKETMRQSILASLDASAEKSMEDMVITEHEEAYFMNFLERFNLSLDDLSPQARQLYLQGTAIRSLLHGYITPCADIFALPFVFHKSECLIWAWRSIALAEIRTNRRIVGRSQGMSFRIMRGVYWRTGGFGGEAVSRQEMQELGEAVVAVTTKHIYYHLQGGTKRVRLEKIIGILPYADAVLVSLDGTNAKPLCFFTDSPAFLANVIQNASNCDA